VKKKKITPKQRNEAYIRDVIKAGEQAIRYTRNKNFVDFVSDDYFRNAVERALEILGEAVKNLSPETKAEFPFIEWQEISRFRDKLAHHYWAIDHTVVWGIVKGPQLVELIDTLKGKLGEQE